MTKAQKSYTDRVARFGCILCHHKGTPGTPASIHHIRRLGGKREAAPIIPLCFFHHQGGGYGIAIHSGREAWEANHGITELELLALLMKEIDQ